MALQIINLICVILAGFIAGVFIDFVVFKLRKIDSQTDNIFKPKHHWGMRVYMDNIPQNEQNILHLSSVPLKMYERGEYSDLIVPHIGEEVGGTYYSGNHEFSMKFSMVGIVTNVHYNTDLDLIVVSCKCTEIRKI